MIESYREKFNRQFTAEKYRKFLEEVQKDYIEVPFRIAETPVFIPKDLTQKLIAAGADIMQQIAAPEFKTLTEKAIPQEWAVPGENTQPHFVCLDFGITEDEIGQLKPMLIELQGFPSLFGFQNHVGKAYREVYDIPLELNYFLNGYTEESYLKLLKEVIVGDHNPRSVVIMDVHAYAQKTLIDFYITAKALGIKVKSVTEIKARGAELYYEENGEQVRVQRIFNRMIFDEVAHQPEVLEMGFDPRKGYDVEWVTHPNWFYRISKYSLPFLKSPYIPDTYFLNEVVQIPADLENYVLKPLFSFAGTGVMIDPSLADIQQIKDPENWILQKKVNYVPALKAPNGGVKVEVRLLYIWPEGQAPILSINLARLSKGKMVGVAFNRDLDWVGGSICFMEQP